MAVTGSALSLVLGCLVVRFGLALSDARPYEGAATERSYIVVAVLAMIVWWGGSAISIVLAVRRRPGRADAVRHSIGVRSTCRARDMSWPRAVALRTDRLSLEPLAVEHASEMVAALASPTLYRYTGGHPPALDELEARYRRQVRGGPEDGRAGWSNWIVRPAVGGPAIGFVQATLTREGSDLVAELAWLITPSGQGRGLAGEAASAVASWLTSSGATRLRAHVHPEHEASARIAQRLGLAPTSTLVDGEIRWEAPSRS